MTNRDLNYLRMVVTRKGVMNANTALWSGNIKISATKTAVESLYTQILTDAGMQEEDISGTTKAKDTAWTTAAGLGVHVSTCMRAYAEDIGNATLYEMMHYKKSDLDRGEVQEAINKMTLIYNQASLVPIASLTPFNLTAVILTNFNAAIQNLTNAFPQHGIIQAVKKTSTISIKNNFALLRVAGKKLNTLVGTLGLTQPAFVQTYKNACIIIDLGKGQMAEEVILQPNEHKVLFKNKFLPNDTFTVRNHSELANIKVYLSDDSNIPPIDTGGVTLMANSEIKLSIPTAFNMAFGHNLIVQNISNMDDAHVTVVLAHGKSNSSAGEPSIN